MKTLSLAVLAMLLTSKVDAQTFSTGGMCPCAQQQVKNLLFTAPITHIGGPPKQPQTLIKDGGKAPTLLTFQRILPPGWNVQAGNLTEPLPVDLTWPGQKNWYEALGEALIQASLRADLDWNTHTITLHTQRLSAALPISTMQVQQAASTITQALPEVKNTPKQADNKPVWEIKKSDSFGAVMAAWATTAEASLINEASIDFVFDNGNKFPGSYWKAVCDVIQAVNDSQAENGKTTRLNAGFWPGNWTVRISDKAIQNAPRTCHGTGTAGEKS